MNKNTCAQLNWCIVRAMVYAEHDDFQQGRASFISDLSKTPCTKTIIKQSGFDVTMFYGEITNLDEFKKIINLVILPHKCTCSK